MRRKKKIKHKKTKGIGKKEKRGKRKRSPKGCKYLSLKVERGT